LSIRQTRTTGNNAEAQDITLTNVCFGGNKATGDSTRGGAGYFEQYKTVKQVTVDRAAENSANTCDGLFLDDEVGDANRCDELVEGGNCTAQDDLPTR
jgi:hypothetical protein